MIGVIEVPGTSGGVFADQQQPQVSAIPNVGAGLPAQRQARQPRQAARDGARRSSRAVGAGFPAMRNAPLPGDARATAIIASPHAKPAILVIGAAGGRGRVCRR
jgi:hypothetical protein